MAIPTKKSPEIEKLLTSITGKNRPSEILADSCVMCGGSAIDFKNELSQREFSISGMCQTCQNEIFDV